MTDHDHTLSLHQFGDQVQCDYTTASRLLSGDRRPSSGLLNRICDAFSLDHGEALRTLGEDQKLQRDGKSPRFAAWLRAKVFETRDGDQDRLAS